MRWLTTERRRLAQLAFSAEGRSLFAWGMTEEYDYRLDAWDLTGDCSEVIRTRFDSYFVTLFANLPGGRLLALIHGPTTADRMARVSRLVIDEGKANLPWVDIDIEHLSPRRFAASPDGRHLVGVSRDSTQKRNPMILDYGWETVYHDALVLWRVAPGELPSLVWETPPSQGRTTEALCFSADSNRIWTAEKVSSSIDFIPWDVSTGTVCGAVVNFPRGDIADMGFAPDGAWLVARDNETLFVYDAREMARAPITLVHPTTGTSLSGFAFHPSGKWLAAPASDGTVTIWDTASWRITRCYDWKLDHATCLCFSPDGSLGAVGTESGQVVLWDVDY